MWQEQQQADYICEAIDQTRGWFYSLHAISTLLFDRPAYKNASRLGHILAEDGSKMSKSKGNVVNPWRSSTCMGPTPRAGTCTPPARLATAAASALTWSARRCVFLNTIWNTYSFFVTYANLSDFSLASHSEEGTSSAAEKSPSRPLGALRAQ
ncbi:MAG: class I tRNA ligase family protein [Caldilineaceae bacterium]